MGAWGGEEKKAQFLQNIFFFKTEECEMAIILRVKYWQNIVWSSVNKLLHRDIVWLIQCEKLHPFAQLNPAFKN